MHRGQALAAHPQRIVLSDGSHPLALVGFDVAATSDAGCDHETEIGVVRIGRIQQRGHCFVWLRDGWLLFVLWGKVVT
jgi:hypothetical protein